MIFGRVITGALTFTLMLSASTNADAQQSGNSSCEPLAQIIRDANIKVRPQGFFRVSGWPETMKNSPLIVSALMSQHSVAEVVDLLRKQGKVSEQLEQKILEFMPSNYSAGYSNFGPKGRHAMLEYTAGTDHCQGIISLTMNEGGEWTANKFLSGDSTMACGESKFSLIKFDGKPVIFYGSDTKSYSTFILDDAERFSPLCQIEVFFRPGYHGDIADRGSEYNRGCDSALCRMLAARAEEIATSYRAEEDLTFTLEALSDEQGKAVLAQAKYVELDQLPKPSDYVDPKWISMELQNMLEGEPPDYLRKKNNPNFHETFVNKIWHVQDVSTKMEYFGWNLNTSAAFRLSKSSSVQGGYELRYLPLPMKNIPGLSYGFDFGECEERNCRIAPILSNDNLYFLRYGDGWMGWRHYKGVLLDALVFNGWGMTRRVSGSLDEEALGPPKLKLH